MSLSASIAVPAAAAALAPSRPRGAAEDRQLALCFPERPLRASKGARIAPALGRPNLAARRLMAAVAAGGARAGAVVGEIAAGKSALTMSVFGARVIPVEALTAPDALAGLPRDGSGVAVDGFDSALARVDAARAAALEEGLFALLNRCAALGVGVLLTGRSAPARWRVGLRDLASRLTTLAVERISPPDDALLRALLSDAFARRGLRVPARTQSYLLARMARDYEAPHALAERLDRAALTQGRAVTPALAAELFGWRRGA